MTKVATTHSNFTTTLLPPELNFSVFLLPLCVYMTPLLRKMGPTSKVSHRLKGLTKAATSAKKGDKNRPKFSSGGNRTPVKLECVVVNLVIVQGL